MLYKLNWMMKLISILNLSLDFISAFKLLIDNAAINQTNKNFSVLHNFQYKKKSSCNYILQIKVTKRK